MLDIGLGTGYLSSSAGAKQKRQDAKAIEELISDQVEHDPIKHLEILEYMASKFRCKGRGSIHASSHGISAGGTRQPGRVDRRPRGLDQRR